MIERSKFYDVQGRPYTQSLFLEHKYDEEVALYTYKDHHFEYKGKTYPSLRQLYLECEDPTEYSFALKHLGSWYQWQRMQENKIVLSHINSWREELEVRLRSQAVRNMIDMACSEDGNFSAAKYLAEYGWEKRKAGRPSKDEIKRHLVAEQHIHNDFDADIKRLDDYRKGNKNG